MRKFIILSILIALFVCRLSTITEGDEGKGNSQNTAPSQELTVNHGAVSDDPLYAQAMSDFQSGMYSDAVEKFKMVLQQEPGDSPKKERVLRSIADCHYLLGLKGNRNSLITATDLYKNVMQKYPASRNENAIALYRMADSYAVLSFYYEAKREFENFITMYPESPYMSEVHFRIGEMVYQTKKFDEAALKFEEYVHKYPDGKDIKTAYFKLGDCYSQIHQEEKANKWYHEALNKWPELENIPEDILLNIGSHYYRNMKYREALNIFFFYMNVYPDKENYTEVLFNTARSFMELDQLPLSLKMFSLLIERFPNSREALEGTIIMANIGVKKPGMKVPSYFHGMQNYRDPLQAYNNVLARFPSGDYTEELLFQKGYVLYRNGRYKESFDAYNLLLNQFPKGRYKEASVKYFLANTDRLVEENYTKGDYLALAEIYFTSREYDFITGDNFKISYSIGDSLRRVGLYAEAVEVFDKLLKTSGNTADKNKTVMAIADTECDRGNYENAEKILQQLSLALLEVDRGNRKSRYKGKVIVKSPVPEGHMQKNINRIMGNIYFKKAVFDKAALYYAKVLVPGEEIEGMAVIHRNYAECMKTMNSLPLAIANYQKAIEIYNRESKKYPVEVIIDSYRGLGDCLFEGGKYLEAISMYKQSLVKIEGRNENLWSVYSVGRGYAAMKNSGMVNTTFSELKNKGGEGFWSNIADHALREYSWNEMGASTQQ